MPHYAVGVPAWPSVEGSGNVAQATWLLIPDGWRCWCAVPRVLFCKADAWLAVEAGFRVLLDVNDDLVDDEDLVGCEGADDGPKYRYGRAQNGNVDFEDAEEVHDGCVVRHVRYGDSTGAIDAEGYHAAY